MNVPHRENHPVEIVKMLKLKNTNRIGGYTNSLNKSYCFPFGAHTILSLSFYFSRVVLHFRNVLCIFILFVSASSFLLKWRRSVEHIETTISFRFICLKFLLHYRQFFVCSTSTQQFRISSHEERTIITYYIVRPTTLFQFEWDVTFSIEIVHSFAMQVHMVLMCFFCNRLLL